MNYWLKQILEIINAPGAWKKATLPTCLYWALGLFMAWQSRFVLTPDGFSYIQAARHYAEGSLTLAVNSWWSPMLSWLTVPFIWAKVQPILAIRLMDVAFGWGFSAGVGELTRTITGKGWLAGYVLGLLSVLIMLPRYLTPVIFLMCVVVWYFVMTAKLLQTDSVEKAFRIGLLGGMAYLVKAIALPFVLVHFPVTVLLKIYFGGWSRIRHCFQEYAAAMLGVALVAGPWILIISLHDGRPTISSASRYASLWSGTPDYQAMPFKHLNFPREGRIWCWEDPTEVRGTFKTWSAFDGWAGFRKQLQVIVENIQTIPEMLNTIDHLGLMTLGLVFSILCVFPLREAMRSWRGRWQFWGLVSGLIYIAGYLPHFIYDRYLWPSWAIWLALFVAGPVTCHGSEAAASVRAARMAALPGWQRALSRFHPWFLLAMTTVFVLSVANEIRILFKPGEVAKYGAELKIIGEELKGHRLFVSNKWRPGLYTTYWANSRFLGELTGKTPESIAAELVPFGHPTLIIFGDRKLAEALKNSTLFTLLETRANHFWAFEIATKQSGGRQESIVPDEPSHASL